MKNYLLIILLLICVKMHGQLAAADSLLSIGDYKNAIEIYKTSDDSYFKLARAYSQLGDVYGALSSYQDGFKKDSLSVQPRFEYARLALGNNDPAAAFDVLGRLIVEFPENATYRYYMGKTYDDLGREDDAVSFFAKAVSLNTSYRAARIELVKILIKKSKFNNAILNAKKGLALYENDLKLNSLIAQAYLGAKRYDMAIKHFELLFKLGYDTDFNRKNLAWSYLNDSQWQLAVDNYKIYNEVYEDGNSLIYFNMSRAYLKLGELDLAQQCIESSIAFKTPELHQEFLQLATIYVKKGDYKNAFYATKTAKKEKPENDFIGYQYVLAADQFYADKSKKLEFYDEFVIEYPNSSFMEYVEARRKDLRKEIFLAAKK